MTPPTGGPYGHTGHTAGPAANFRLPLLPTPSPHDDSNNITLTTAVAQHSALHNRTLSPLSRQSAHSLTFTPHSPTHCQLRTSPHHSPQTLLNLLHQPIEQLSSALNSDTLSTCRPEPSFSCLSASCLVMRPLCIALWSLLLASVSFCPSAVQSEFPAVGFNVAQVNTNTLHFSLFPAPFPSAVLSGSQVVTLYAASDLSLSSPLAVFEHTFINEDWVYRGCYTVDVYYNPFEQDYGPVDSVEECEQQAFSDMFNTIGLVDGNCMAGSDTYYNVFGFYYGYCDALGNTTYYPVYTTQPEPPATQGSLVIPASLVPPQPTVTYVSYIAQFVLTYNLSSLGQSSSAVSQLAFYPLPFPPNPYALQHGSTGVYLFMGTATNIYYNVYLNVYDTDRGVGINYTEIFLKTNPLYTGGFNPGDTVVFTGIASNPAGTVTTAITKVLALPPAVPETLTASYGYDSSISAFVVTLNWTAPPDTAYTYFVLLFDSWDVIYFDNTDEQTSFQVTAQQGAYHGDYYDEISWTYGEQLVFNMYISLNYAGETEAFFPPVVPLGVPDTVLNVQAQSYHDSSITVSWILPATANSSSYYPVIGYLVCYTDGPDNSSVTVPPFTTSVVLTEGIVNGLLYAVTVQTLWEGQSWFVDMPNVTVPATANATAQPLAVPAYVTGINTHITDSGVDADGSQFVIVSWQPLLYGQCGGATTDEVYFIVTCAISSTNVLSPPLSACGTFNASLSDSSLVVTGLLPNSQTGTPLAYYYQFSVQSCNDAGCNSPDLALSGVYETVTVPTNAPVLTLQQLSATQAQAVIALLDTSYASTGGSSQFICLLTCSQTVNGVQTAINVGSYGVTDSTPLCTYQFQAAAAPICTAAYQPYGWVSQSPSTSVTLASWLTGAAAPVSVSTQPIANVVDQFVLTIQAPVLNTVTLATAVTGVAYSVTAAGQTSSVASGSLAYASTQSYYYVTVNLPGSSQGTHFTVRASTNNAFYQSSSVTATVTAYAANTDAPSLVILPQTVPGQLPLLLSSPAGDIVSYVLQTVSATTGAAVNVSVEAASPNTPTGFVFVPSGLPAAGDRFTLSLQAIDASDFTSESSPSLTGVTVGVLPLAPTNFAVSQQAASTLTLTFIPSTSSGGYAIQNYTVSWVSVSPVASSTTSVAFPPAPSNQPHTVAFTDTTLPPGSIVTLMLTANTAFGSSPAATTVTTMASPPAAPLTVQVTQEGLSALLISFSQPASQYQPVTALNLTFTTFASNQRYSVISAVVAVFPFNATTSVSQLVPVSSLPYRPSCDQNSCIGLGYTVTVVADTTSASGVLLGSTSAAPIAFTLATAPFLPNAWAVGVLPLTITQVAGSVDSVNALFELHSNYDGGLPITSLTLFWFVNDGNTNVAAVQSVLNSLGSPNQDSQRLSTIALGNLTVVAPVSGFVLGQVYLQQITASALTGIIQVALVINNALGSSNAWVSQPLNVLTAPVSSPSLTTTQLSLSTASVKIQPPPASDLYFQVPATASVDEVQPSQQTGVNRYFMDTGIDVVAGSVLTLTVPLVNGQAQTWYTGASEVSASGSSNNNALYGSIADYSPVSYTTVDGSSSGQLPIALDYAYTSASASGDIAGPAFLIGLSYSVVVETNGRLYLGRGQLQTTFNAGKQSLDVLVSLTSPQSAVQLAVLVDQSTAGLSTYNYSLSVPADHSSFVLSDLQCGSTYQLTAVSSNVVGAGPGTSSLPFFPVCAPPAPVILNVVQSSGTEVDAIVAGPAAAYAVTTAPNVTLNGLYAVPTLLSNGSYAVSFTGVSRVVVGTSALFALTAFYSNVAGAGAVGRLSFPFTGLATPPYISAVQSGANTASVVINAQPATNSFAAPTTSYTLCAVQGVVTGPCQWGQIGNVNLTVNTASYVFSGLTASSAGTVWTLLIVANNIAGQSTPAATSVTIYGPAAPPTSLSITQLSATTVSVSITSSSIPVNSVPTVQLWVDSLATAYTYLPADLSGTFVFTLAAASTTKFVATTVNIANQATVAQDTQLQPFSAVTTALAGLSSSLTQSFTLFTAPAAPITLSATATGQCGQVMLNWSIPASSAPVSSFVIAEAAHELQLTVPHSATGSSSVGQLVVELQDGVNYTFSVESLSVAGASASATFSPIASRCLATAPASPSGTQYQNAQSVVSWPAVAVSSGTAITGYSLQCTSPVDHNFLSPVHFALSATATSYTLTGLVNGDSYTCQLALVNAVGSGPYSAASAPIYPGAAPSAPLSVSATQYALANSTVSWQAPTSTGGYTVTSYTVSCTASSTLPCAVATLAVTAGSSLQLTMKGLVNGGQYSFQVTATNAVGTSSASAAVSAQTTAAPTNTPTATIVQTQLSSANVTISLPDTSYASTGGLIGSTSLTCHLMCSGSVVVSPSVSQTVQHSTAFASGYGCSYSLTGLTAGQLLLCAASVSNAAGSSPTSLLDLLVVGEPYAPSIVSAQQVAGTTNYAVFVTIPPPSFYTPITAINLAWTGVNASGKAITGNLSIPVSAGQLSYTTILQLTSLPAGATYTLTPSTVNQYTPAQLVQGAAVQILDQSTPGTPSFALPSAQSTPSVLILNFAASSSATNGGGADNALSQLAGLSHLGCARHGRSACHCCFVQLVSFSAAGGGRQCGPLFQLFVDRGHCGW